MRSNLSSRPVLIVLLLSVSWMITGSAAFAEAQPERIVGLAKPPSPDAAAKLDSLFYDYQIFDLPLPAIEQQVRETGRLMLLLGGRDFDLELELRNLRGPGHRAVLVHPDGTLEDLELPPPATFAGRVVGDPSSEVRLLVRGDYLEGFLRTAGEHLFLEPVSLFDRQASKRQVVVYRDLDAREHQIGCGNASQPADGGPRLQPLSLTSVDPLASVDALASVDKAPSQDDVVDLATEADGDFVQDVGLSVAQNRIASAMNIIDSTFSSDLGIDVSHSFQVYWSNRYTDPYTASNSVTRLNQIKSYWDSAFGWVNRDAVHQFTTIDLDNNGIAGRAKGIGVICDGNSVDNSEAYSVQEDRSSTFLRGQILAHEVAHILGAGHVDFAPCRYFDCGDLDGPLMCPFLQANGTNSFLCCTIEVVEDKSPCFDIREFCMEF